MTTSTIDARVSEVLRATAGHGIAASVPFPPQALDPETFRTMLHTAREHRLVGPLAEAVFDGALELEGEQLELLTEYHASAQAHVLQLEQGLLTVVDRFSQHGIEVRVLKGLSLARTIYCDPAWRVASDIDLLIPADRFDDSVAIATGEFGGTQNVVELRPGFDREFGKEALVQLGEVELDLHRTWVAGPFGHTIDLDELFAEHGHITIGGRELATLSPRLQFMHACYNTALGDYPVRLCSIRDLLLCEARLHIDHDAVIETATRWKGIAVVQRAAQAVLDTVGPEAGHAFKDLANLTVPRSQQWLMRSYLTPARSYTRPLAMLAVIRGVRPRARYARAILVPSRAYLQSRGWSATHHIKRAADRLRRHE